RSGRLGPGSAAGGSAAGGSAAGGSAAGGSVAGGSAAGGSGGSAAAGASGAAGSSSAGEADPGAGETGIFVGGTAAHNEARAELGLPELAWSPEIAAFAQQWSDTLASEQCGSIAHRDQRRYG